jgi:CRP-like cAMP-binding protein
MKNPEFLSNSTAQWGLYVPRGAALFQAQSTGPVWRVTQGVFCVEHCMADSASVIHLALPGDVVGTEAWCHSAYAYTVTALTRSHAQTEPLTSDQDRAYALAWAMRQQQLQMQDMAVLRSGPVAARLRHLLQMLGRCLDGQTLAVARKDLPTLKDMAKVVDSTPETICRELNRLLPASPRSEPVSYPSWFSGGALLGAAY